ncbi:hypothetical protein HDC92_003847 [Pedobacter sp. AK017]|uniref:DUF4129 domain-containing protein n=1 Tax=Pedobacter sp. AK017 TaxID=2723073 RepID=UPI00160B539E|nr:DUF4129 domain-containing protein [Pedobacter sp. AK017]MBB5440147.1 hypothetical protein [Pedobacter sp. AK017]
MRKALFVLLLCCLTLPVFASVPAVKGPVQPARLINDSTNLKVRRFDLQQMDAYRAQKAFRYDDVAPLHEGLWEKFWRWVWRQINDLISNKYSGGFLKYLLIAGVVAIFVFVIVKMLGLDLRIFAGKPKVVEVPYTESADNIHEINFNEEIERAIAAANYRLAVRLFYLYSLKRLDESALISWLPEKTNQTYIAELADPEKRQQFSRLTTQFEYIWYGEFFIDKETFGYVKGDFDRFNGKGT